MPRPPVTVRSLPCGLAAGLLALLAGAAHPAGPDALGGEEEPAAQLEALVDLPTAPLRAKRAEDLSRRKGISLEQWRAAMASFGRFRPVGKGAHRDLVEYDGQALLRGRAAEKTEISFYVPELYDPKKPAPLLLTLHGSGSDGRDDHRRWQQVADQLGMVVVSPTDRRGIGGYTKGTAEREAVWKALRWARRTFNVDECRIFLTGISRGGHLAWDVALREPDRFAVVAPMIGGPLVSISRGSNNVRYAENLVHVTVRDLQGAKDDPILVENLRLTFERLEALGAKDAKLIEFPDRGHGFDFQAVDWPALLQHTRRPATPERVVRRSAREAEGRSHWVEILDTKRPVAETFQLKVDPGAWRTMTAGERREEVVKQAEDRTARVEARLLGPGRVALTTRHVKKLRLLLTPEMLGEDGVLEVTVNGRTRKMKPRPDKAVLLHEFAERFDRTFLPVAEAVVRP